MTAEGKTDVPDLAEPVQVLESSTTVEETEDPVSKTRNEKGRRRGTGGSATGRKAAVAVASSKGGDVSTLERMVVPKPQPAKASHDASEGTVVSAAESLTTAAVAGEGGTSGGSKRPVGITGLFGAYCRLNIGNLNKLSKCKDTL